MTAADLAARWPGGARKRAEWWDVRCTAKEHGGDERASLSLTDDHEKGRVRTICRKATPCSFRSIAEGSPFKGADFFHAPATHGRQNGHAAAPRPTIEATYDYRDEAGGLRSQTVRMRPKTFYQRRPDGHDGWINDLKGVTTICYRLATLRAELAALPEGERFVAVTEGEKDCDTLVALGIPATTSPMGAGKFHAHHAAQLRSVGAEGVLAFRDADISGEGHAAGVSRHCLAAGLRVKRIILPGLEVLADKHGKDVTDWLETHSPDELRAVMQTAGGSEEKRNKIGPWSAAQPVASFLAVEDAEVQFLDVEHTLSPGALSEWFSPRGLGKTHVLHAKLVELARQGKRVLLLDRDNPRSEIKRRLRAWGAAELVDHFKIMTRDDAPPLTNRAAWEQFPFADYDVVALDSLDAATEGVGEQDSTKPALALAALLDLAHRADGPAVIVLGNTTKNGAAGRGSGVVEDRADIVFEIRDATDFHPTGTKAWWEELPPAARIDWASRATRRKRRDTYRLAFIASKFRVGAEPDPFVLEIDLTTTPWLVSNVTDDLVAAGEAAKEQAQAERETARSAAASALADEVARRAATAKPLTTDEAVDLLRDHGLKHRGAREAISANEGVLWVRKTLTDVQGRPKVLLPPIKNDALSETSPSQDPHKQSGFAHGVSDDRMNTERRKHSLSGPAKTAEILAGVFPTPLAHSSPVANGANGADDDMVDIRP